MVLSLVEVNTRGLVARTGTRGDAREEGRGSKRERERLSDSQSWFTAVLPLFCISHQNPAACLQLQLDAFGLLSYIHKSLADALL